MLRCSALVCRVGRCSRARCVSLPPRQVPSCLTVRNSPSSAPACRGCAPAPICCCSVVCIVCTLLVLQALNVSKSWRPAPRLPQCFRSFVCLVHVSAPACVVELPLLVRFSLHPRVAIPSAGPRCLDRAVVALHSLGPVLLESRCSASDRPPSPVCTGTACTHQSGVHLRFCYISSPWCHQRSTRCQGCAPAQHPLQAAHDDLRG